MIEENSFIKFIKFKMASSVHQISMLVGLLLIVQTRVPVLASNCLGDDKMCDACGPLGGDSEWDGCKEITEACKAEICDVLCLRSSFSCKFEFKCSGWDGCASFLEQAKDDRVSNALCSQFKGKTCGKDGLKCCEDDLHEWVEDRTYGGYFPILPIPLEACLHDPNDDEWKGCDACEATFEIVDTGSRWPAPTDFTQEGKQLPAPGTAEKAAQTSLIPPDSLIPDYKNLQYKHNLLLKKVKSKKFESKDICKCLGCCKGECYFPVDSSTLDPWA